MSPFLLDQLDDFFVGGVDDMAAWTQIIWRDFIHMLEHGQKYLFILYLFKSALDTFILTSEIVLLETVSGSLMKTDLILTAHEVSGYTSRHNEDQFFFPDKLQTHHKGK